MTQGSGRAGEVGERLSGYGDVEYSILERGDVADREIYRAVTVVGEFKTSSVTTADDGLIPVPLGELTM